MLGNFFNNFYQVHYQSAKQLGSRSGQKEHWVLSVLIFAQTVCKGCSYLKQGKSKYLPFINEVFTLTLLSEQAVRASGEGTHTVKPVLSSLSKIDKTKLLKIKFNGSLMKFESIAECSTWSILQYF